MLLRKDNPPRRSRRIYPGVSLHFPKHLGALQGAGLQSLSSLSFRVATSAISQFTADRLIKMNIVSFLLCWAVDLHSELRSGSVLWFVCWSFAEKQRIRQPHCQSKATGSRIQSNTQSEILQASDKASSEQPHSTDEHGAKEFLHADKLLRNSSLPHNGHQTHD